MRRAQFTKDFILILIPPVCAFAIIIKATAAICKSAFSCQIMKERSIRGRFADVCLHMRLFLVSPEVFKKLKQKMIQMRANAEFVYIVT